MKGFECCAKLLSIESSQYTPVLMVSIVEDTSSIENAFLAGATDYVIKPFYWPVLRQRINPDFSQAVKNQFTWTDVRLFFDTSSIKISDEDKLSIKSHL
ncbi:Two-component response regulator, PleD family [Nostoc flagelliforme CCNUN1]|uniref:Two-component response regulator, PleD family n=1 Tax=Nostoc flagelliforme CCNUN1 TaxID=2038116 RepID=A0A2K8SHU9_9NOSO|nr:Two-component response regulator, PleD family [Nostoc flagelliforme CCNUN1]